MDPTDPECDNYDYCLTLPELTGNFTISKDRRSAPFGNGEYYEYSAPIIDTTFGGLISFKSLDSTATSYVWRFSTDPRERPGREVSADFFYGTTSGAQDVTLTLKRDVLDCPDRNADSITVTKSIFIINSLNPQFDGRPLIGKFRGNNRSEPELGDFTIEFFYDEAYTAMRVKNLPRNAINGERLNNAFVTDNYKSFFIPPSENSCCSRIYGSGQLTPDKRSLTIDYKVYNKVTEKWTDLVWEGTRIE